MHTQHRSQTRSQAIIKGLVLGVFSAGMFLWVPSLVQAEEPTVHERIQKLEWNISGGLPMR